jgi:hypothetical protein
MYAWIIIPYKEKRFVNIFDETNIKDDRMKALGYDERPNITEESSLERIRELHAKKSQLDFLENSRVSQWHKIDCAESVLRDAADANGSEYVFNILRGITIGDDW